MGFLIGPPKISPAERDGCLAYIRTELILWGFLKREVDRYSSSVEKYGDDLPDGHRLHAAAMELLEKRARDCPSAPEAAKPLRLLYQDTYESWEALVCPKDRTAAHLSTLSKRFDKAWRKADRGVVRFLKGLRLSAEEHRFLSTASIIVRNGGLDAADRNPSDLEEEHGIRLTEMETAFLGIGKAVVSGSTRAAQAISDGIGLAESDPDRWKVGTELLGFFLHYMSRRAISKGGTDFRARLQDAVVEPAIRGLIDASWKTEKAIKGFDDKAWKEEMFVDTVRNINAAETEYSELTEIYGGSVGDMFADNSVLGKLAGNVMSLIEIDNPIAARMVVWTTAGNALVDSGLIAAIDEAAGHAPRVGPRRSRYSRRRGRPTRRSRSP